MICQYCGKENVSDAKFCRGCGNRLEGDNSGRETVIIRSTSAEDEAVESDIADPNKSRILGESADVADIEATGSAKSDSESAEPKNATDAPAAESANDAPAPENATSKDDEVTVNNIATGDDAADEIKADEPGGNANDAPDEIEEDNPKDDVVVISGVTDPEPADVKDDGAQANSAAGQAQTLAGQQGMQAPGSKDDLAGNAADSGSVIPAGNQNPHAPWEKAPETDKNAPKKCPHCGRENPPQAVFCGVCGNRISEQQGSSKPPTKGFVERLKDVFKGTFKDPDGYIESAKKDGGYWSVTILALVIQSFLTVIFFLRTIIQLGNGLSSFTYNFGGSSSYYSTSTINPVIYIEVFLGILVMEFVLLVSLYLFGRIFGGKLPFANWLGLAAPTCMIPFAGIILTRIVSFLGAFGALLASLLSVAGTAMCYILLWKAFEAYEIKCPKNIYAFLCALMAFLAAAGIITMIFATIIVASMVSV